MTLIKLFGFYKFATVFVCTADTVAHSLECPFKEVHFSDVGLNPGNIITVAGKKSLLRHLMANMELNMHLGKK